MEKLKIKKKEIGQIYTILGKMLSIKDAKDSNVDIFNFRSFLIAYRSKLKPYIEEIQELTDLFKKDLDLINSEYCVKDEDGKPIKEKVFNGNDSEGKPVYVDSVLGLRPFDNLERDKKIKLLEESYENSLSGCIEIDVSNIKIKRENIPFLSDEFDGIMQEIIQHFIVE